MKFNKSTPCMKNGLISRYANISRVAYRCWKEVFVIRVNLEIHAISTPAQWSRAKELKNTKAYSSFFFLVFESLSDNNGTTCHIKDKICVCVMGNLLTKAVSPGLIVGSTLSRPYLLFPKKKKNISLPIKYKHSLQIACMVQRSY